MISDVVHWWGAASWLWPPCGQLVGEAPPPKKRRKMVFGWGWHLLFCAHAKRDERKVVSDAVWHGAGIKDKKGPPPPKDQRPNKRPGRKAWKKRENKEKERRG